MMYIFAVVLTVVIQYFALHLQNIKLAIPFIYNKDSLMLLAEVKSMIENGWYLSNKYVGLPFSSGNYDFPQFDTLHFFIIKLISIFYPNYGISVNLYYLFLFPITTLTTLYVLRHFKVSWVVGIFTSLLFSFLPFRLMRSTNQLFLCSYYLIPLSLIVFDWQFIEKRKTDSRKNNRNFMISLLISLGIGLSGLYYAYFYCFFLSIIALKKLFQKNINKFATTLTIIIFTLIILSLNVVPNIIYIMQNSSNFKATTRIPGEAETYGLKIAKLFIPPNWKGIPFINSLRTQYLAQTTFNTGTEYLGIFGIIGLFILLMTLIRIKLISRSNQTLLNNLSYINIFALLLSTIGGFGSLIAFSISPQIRGYDRMSVYIAFFSLTALALVLDNFYTKFCKTRTEKTIFIIVIFCLLICGIIDQTNDLVFPYKHSINEFVADDEFIKSIQKTVPRESRIFQLPYVPYPESMVQSLSYDHFKPYLHSSDLYWSYGSVKGRIGDMWQQYTISLPIEKFISAIYLAGFTGLYIDRNGYEDNGLLIEKELNLYLEKPSIISNNNRYLFYNLSNLKNNYLSFDKKTFDNLKQQALNSILIDWGEFYSLETNSANTWRWAPKRATIKIMNTTGSMKKVVLKTTFITNPNYITHIEIKTSIFGEKLEIKKGFYAYQKEIRVPPGTFNISFTSDSIIIAPGDNRDLSFSLMNTHIY